MKRKERRLMTTCTQETKVRYAKIKEGLDRQYSESQHYNPFDAVDGMLNFLTEKVTKLKQKSRNHLRWVLDHHFAVLGDEQSRDDLAASAANWPPVDKNLPLRTSDKKAKRLKEEDMALLVEYVGGDKKHGPIASALIIASALTGPRNREWSGAEIVGDELIFQNSKATNNRAHGPDRRIGIGELNDEEREAIHFVVATKNADPVRWPKTMNSIEYIVRREGKKLFPRRKRRPTVYTMRHIFGASLKRAEKSRAEIAALMGHASTVTAFKHYARKGAGRSGLKVSANPAEVARVRVNHTSPPPSLKKGAKGPGSSGPLDGGPNFA